MFDGKGGRRCCDLMSFSKDASEYSLVVVIVGDNNANYKSMHYICEKFKEFRSAICQICRTHEKEGPSSRSSVDLVSKNNMFYRNQLGFHLKYTRMIRREDFSDVCPYHFDKNGEGFRHMDAFVFKVCREFFDDCSKSVYLVYCDGRIKNFPLHRSLTFCFNFLLLTNQRLNNRSFLCFCVFQFYANVLILFLAILYHLQYGKDTIDLRQSPPTSATDLSQRPPPPTSVISGNIPKCNSLHNTLLKCLTLRGEMTL